MANKMLGGVLGAVGAFMLIRGLRPILGVALLGIGGYLIFKDGR